MKYVVALLSLAGVLHAEDTLRAELVVAASISDSVKRLAAYDDIARSHQLAPAKKTIDQDSGKWRISIDKSPIDDTQTVIGILSANNEVRARFGTDRPTLVIRYREGVLDAYIACDTFLGSKNTPVVLRFGKTQAVTEEWDISLDGKAIFVPGAVASFVEKLSEIDLFVVRFAHYDKNPVTVLFSPNGIREVMTAMNEARTKNINLSRR